MTVQENFDKMDYGPAPEDAGPAWDWLQGGKRKFGHFINGKFMSLTMAQPMGWRTKRRSLLASTEVSPYCAGNFAVVSRLR